MFWSDTVFFLTIFCLLLHEILKTETEIEETQSFAAASLVSVHFVPSVWDGHCLSHQLCQLSAWSAWFTMRNYCNGRRQKKPIIALFIAAQYWESKWLALSIANDKCFFSVWEYFIFDDLGNIVFGLLWKTNERQAWLSWLSFTSRIPQVWLV